MVSRNIAADVKPGFETEVAEAIGFSLDKRDGQGAMLAATDAEIAVWINRQIDAAVYRYRDSKRPDISRVKPTVER